MPEVNHRRPAALAAGLSAACALALAAGSAVFAQGGAADPVVPRPGLYRVSTTMLEMSDSDAPAALDLDAMNATFAAAGPAITYCIAAQDTASDMLSQVSGQDCKFATFDIAGQQIDTRLICKGPNGGAVITRTYGTIGADGFDLIAELAAPGISTRMKIQTERVGDCPAESVPAED